MTNQIPNNNHLFNRTELPVIVQFIDGVFAIIIGIVLVSLSTSENNQSNIAMFIFIFGILAFIFSWGLWKRKEWSYRLSKGHSLVSFFFALITLPLGFLLFFAGFMQLYVLSTPEIKEIFGISGFWS